MSTLAIGILGYLTLVLAGDTLLAMSTAHTPVLAVGERVALSFALGAGAISLLLLWGSLFLPGAFSFVCIVLVVASLAFVHRHLHVWLQWIRRLPSSLGSVRVILRSLDVWSVLVAIILGFEVLGNAATTFLTGLNWDALAIWELKARIVFVSGGLPLSYLADASRQWSHLDYPWLLPFTESWFFFLGGHSSVFLAKLALPGFYASLLLVLYFGLRRTQPRWLCFIAAALLGTIPIVTVWAATGFADTIVALYWLGSGLYMYHWLTQGSRRDLIIAVVLVCLATWAKSEGLVYWVMQGITLLCAPILGKTRRESLESWGIFGVASAVIVAPWVAVKRISNVPQNDFLPVTLQTTVEHIDRLPNIAVQLAHELLNTTHWGILWLVFGGSLLLFPMARHKRARLYLAVSTAVPIAVFALSYLYSRWEPYTDHIQTSLDRLVVQTAPLALLVVTLQFGDLAFATPRSLVGESRAKQASAVAALVGVAVIFLIVRSLAPSTSAALPLALAGSAPLAPADCSEGAALIAEIGFDPYAILAKHRPDVLAAFEQAGWDPNGGCDAIYDAWVQQGPDELPPTTAVAYVREQGWAPNTPQPTPTPPAACHGPAALETQLGYDPYAVLAINRPDVLRFYVANGWQPSQCVAIFDDWLKHPDGAPASTAPDFIAKHGWVPMRTTDVAP